MTSNTGRLDMARIVANYVDGGQARETSEAGEESAHAGEPLFGFGDTGVLDTQTYRKRTVKRALGERGLVVREGR